MSPVTFITGTDTGAGKTLLTALLLAQARQRRIRTLAVKPFSSGSRADAELLHTLQQGELTLDAINPFHFSEPLAPAIAARRARRRISLLETIDKIRAVQPRCDSLLIEGAGGLLAPLGDNFTALDLIAALRAHVVIAARNRLGVINHARLTVQALLRQPGVAERGIQIVLMGGASGDLAASTNHRALAELLPNLTVISIPELAGRLDSAIALRRHAHRLAPRLNQILRAAAQTF